MNPQNAESPTDNLVEFEIDEAIKQSVVFIGQWQNLISTTNWEKGQIIVQWRNELQSQHLSTSHYSDETWSRIVGGVSPQHVGRLRRTYERFGAVFTEYSGVYWSHFYAALEWDDAEMWLEGSLQNKWSVSQMRLQRWEAMGGDPNAKPKASEIVDSEVEEELQSIAVSENLDATKKKEYTDEYVPGPRDEAPDFGDEPKGKSGSKDGDDDDRVELTSEARSPAMRLFAEFNDLPSDIDAATESFKLCIIRHKADSWADFPREKMLALLDALKQLAATDFAQ